MAKKMLIVTGATGAQGGSVIDAVLADSQLNNAWAIRGITRNASAAAGRELVEKGVEVVEADLNDVASLRNAFQGADAVFAVTNFWGKASKDTEVSQGKNMADVCKEVGANVIFSSLPSVSRASEGKVTTVHHWDGKAEVEEYIRGLGIAAAFVYAGWYMENFPKVVFKLDKEANKYKWSLPCPSTAELPLIDCISDFGKFVTPILLDSHGFNGQVILAAKEYVSLETVTSTYNQLKPTSWGEAEYIRTQGESWLLSEYGYYGGKSLEPSVKTLTAQPRTWADFVQDVHHPAWKDLHHV